jgi:hypothetical protein
MATGDHVTEPLAAAEEEFAEAGFRTGDFGPPRELLAEALAGAEQAGDLAGRAHALDLLGMVAHYDNIAKLISGHRVPAPEIDAEERLFRQALAAWHAADQRPATAQAFFGLARGCSFAPMRHLRASALPAQLHPAAAAGNVRRILRTAGLPAAGWPGGAAFMICW